MTLRIDRTTRVSDGGSLRYRVLADGEVIDKTTGRTAGWLRGKELDEVFSMKGGAAKQRRIKELLGL